MTGDADRLQQVVWNLVSNAVKFTPTGGHVDVELGRTDVRAEILVRDNGQGIDPSFRPHLFQRFRQMDASKTRQHGGLGLGLSIVRHLVEAHGGTVGRRERRPRPWLDLPRGVAAARRGRAGRTSRSPAPGRRIRPLAGVRALVVDDDADATELSRYVLESRGASVVTSGSAGEALHLLAVGDSTSSSPTSGCPIRTALR